MTAAAHRFFFAVFLIFAAAAILMMLAIYSASLRKSLMGNYDDVMRRARANLADFSPIED